jgi:hypothetical protein
MADLSLPTRGVAAAPPINGRVAALALALLIVGAGWLATAVSWRQAALFGVGGALGLVLYHAQFGFTSAFRVFLADRRGADAECRCWSARSCSASACSSAPAAPRARSTPSAAAAPAWSSP